MWSVGCGVCVECVRSVGCDLQTSELLHGDVVLVADMACTSLRRTPLA